MAKARLKYLVLDCETATLPMANEIAKDAEQKKKRTTFMHSPTKRS